MYIAICDDCAQERSQTAELLAGYAAEHGLHLQIKQFADAAEMLLTSAAECFTHYFLDIAMPGINGIDAARKILAINPEAKLVFITSFKEYAYQSYRLHAQDYLLKPIDTTQFTETMNRLMRLDKKNCDGISVEDGRSIFHIPFTSLSYLEVYRKKLHFHTADGQVRQIYGALTDFEKLLLSRTDFTKIHRSFIVNLSHVREIAPKGCVMSDGQNLPISRLLYNDVRGKYMAYLFGEETQI